MNESKSGGRSFDISKWAVQEAFEKVRANKGAAGVDGQSLAEFEEGLKGNLYKLWNRMTSGTYFPPPVRAVDIAKSDGGVRVLGVPTVADRVAQTVVTMYLEPLVEPVFHRDSYGYRPGRSALDAVGMCRRRCWKYDWVVDVDIKSFFDTVPHDLIIKAVQAHTDERWVLLYIKRWLAAPMQHLDGTVVARDRGTPQGSAISPLLANLFMHYAFDVWLSREFPSVQFERYCDDVVMHCRSEGQARRVLDALARRFGGLGVQLHPDKTKIVYCKDGKRRGEYSHVEFTFLGYTFRARSSKGNRDEIYTSFLPAVSKQAKKAMGRKVRSWHLGRRSDLTLGDLARRINSVTRGWINYYGRFYKSELIDFLKRINKYLVHWFTHKYKRQARTPKKARKTLAGISQAYPALFAHWAFGAKPQGWTTGAV
ncbi:group II intron reverse transcriptase/maturase [Amycolatopsis japonica]